MSKDNKIPPKTTQQPVAAHIAKRPLPAPVAGFLKQSGSYTHSLLRYLAPGHSPANEQGRANAELSIDPISSSADRTVPDSAGLNIQNLQDRITACLALQAAKSGAWAIAMRLRPDLAPLSRMRLESDLDGQLTLYLYSGLPEVVEAMKSGISALKSALVPWSSGVPRVEVSHDDSV